MLLGLSSDPANPPCSIFYSPRGRKQMAGDFSFCHSERQVKRYKSYSSCWYGGNFRYEPEEDTKSSPSLSVRAAPLELAGLVE